MKVGVDTSILVSALLSKHPNHGVVRIPRKLITQNAPW